MKQKQDKMTMAEAINSVEISAGSIFSKQDVLDLLKRIRVGNPDIEELKSDIIDEIVDYLDDCDVHLLSDYSLAMSGHTVELESINIDRDTVEIAVNKAFEDCE